MYEMELVLNTLTERTVHPSRATAMDERKKTHAMACSGCLCTYDMVKGNTERLMIPQKRPQDERYESALSWRKGNNTTLRTTYPVVLVLGNTYNLCTCIIVHLPAQIQY